MDRHDHIAARQRAQRLNELVRRVKALRRVAEPERHAQRAVRQCLLHPPVQQLHRVRRQRRASKARHARAQRPAAGEHSQIQRQRLLFERGQVLPHALHAHRLRQRTGHRVKIVQDLRAVRLAAWRDRQPAVAVYDRRQSLPQLRAPKAGAKRRRIGVTVDVNKTRRDGFACRVHAHARLRRVKLPDPGDRSVPNGNVGAEARAPRSVDHRAVFQYIVQQSQHPISP